jgi:hypothetical protein
LALMGWASAAAGVAAAQAAAAAGRCDACLSGKADVEGRAITIGAPGAVTLALIRGALAAWAEVMVALAVAC